MLERLGRLSAATQWVLLLVICAGFFFVWFTRVPLTEVDEARFVGATKEMVDSGNYVIPFFDYVPRYRKPVLIYWLQAASFRMLGVNEVAGRFPSAVASTALVLGLFWFLRKRAVPRLARGDESRQARAQGAVLLSMLALVTIPYVIVYARGALTDATLTLWITGTLLCMLEADLRHTAAPEAKGRYYGLYILAAVFAALGFLTKGPLGLAIPGMVWLVYHARQRDLRTAASRVPWVTSLAVFALIAAPWYVETYYFKGPGGGPGFLRWFFLTEHVDRFTKTMQGHGFGNRILGLFTYVPCYLVLAFPLSIYVLRELFVPFAGDPEPAKDDQIRRIRTFAFTWLVVVIGIFSLSKTQMPEYIQSIVGAIGILFALHLYGRLDPERENLPIPRLRLLETVLIVLFGAIWTGILVGALTNPGKIPGWIGRLGYPQPLTNVLVGVFAALGLLLFASVLFIGRTNDERRMKWSLAAWAVFIGAVMFGAAPVIIRHIHMPTVQMADYLRSIGGKEEVVSYLPGSPEDLVFYSGRKVRFQKRGRDVVPFHEDLNYAFGDRGTALVLTDEKGLAEVKQEFPIQVLNKLYDTYVLRVTKKPSGH